MIGKSEEDWGDQGVIATGQLGFHIVLIWGRVRMTDISGGDSDWTSRVSSCLDRREVKDHRTDSDWCSSNSFYAMCAV